MPRRLSYAFVALCALVHFTPARAQKPHAAPKCPEEAALLPTELAPWTAPTAVTAATRPGEGGNATI